MTAWSAKRGSEQTKTLRWLAFALSERIEFVVGREMCLTSLMRLYPLEFSHPKGGFPCLNGHPIGLLRCECTDA